jgi:hypothetical protein
MSDEKKPSSWWTTLPGVITAVSGLLTAVGGFLVVLHTLGVFEKSKAPVEQIAAKEAEPRKVVDKPDAKKTTYVITGTNHSFVEKDGFLVSTENGNPLCPTPPGWRTGCYVVESQYRQNWRNTPDGYVANGKKVKTFTNRSERVFEILGTKHAFYVDDGYLYDYPTATILCPWPKAGMGKCQAIEAQYEDRWRNTPNGFIADGREFNRDEVMRQVREGLL